ncbi:hypothetical protein EVAR_52761_1 [Eumeta japonica]|uniref:Uncharacterized protein n=1 Tax=Eumeta variegata TaxID=151549 RepID=A0A4C1XDJ8_EUMVA|nr:hypothetical protein EVAR_52761_1 [Eumeta japonica]
MTVLGDVHGGRASASARMYEAYKAYTAQGKEKEIESAGSGRHVPAIRRAPGSSAPLLTLLTIEGETGTRNKYEGDIEIQRRTGIEIEDESRSGEDNETKIAI